jgi:L-asparagine transporter-like permease
MVAISMFGAMFAWLMIFVTHLFFRKNRGLRFPWLSLAGAGLMAAILLTTAFTREFRMTLVYGVPFLAVLSAIYYSRYRRLG